MFDVFGSVKGLLKLETICIDNNVFRLHYKATAIILIVASLLVTSRQYIGDPIDCIVEEIPNNVSTTLLFLTFFYTLLSSWKYIFSLFFKHESKAGLDLFAEWIKISRCEEFIVVFLR